MVTANLLKMPGRCAAVHGDRIKLQEQQIAQGCNGRAMLNAVKMMEQITAAAGWHAQLSSDES